MAFSLRCLVLWGWFRSRVLTSWVRNPRVCRTGLGPPGRLAEWHCGDDGSSKTKKRADLATSSKATEAESDDRPSRSRDKKKTLSSNVSVVGRSRCDGGPVPSGTNGPDHHRSRSGDRGRRGHRSERHHDSPRSSHSPRCRWSGKWGADPAHVFGRVQLQSQARWPDGCSGVWSCFGEGDGGPAFLVLPLIISVITRGHRRIVGPGPDLSIMTDGRVWTAYKSAGYLSGHQHCREWGGHHFPSKTSAHPSVHQLLDQEQPSRPPAGRGCLAVEGGHRAGHQRDIPRVLPPAVSGSKKDRRFPCSDAPSRTEVFAICGQQASLPFHLSTLRIGNIISQVHQAVTTRRSAVKAARCEAACLLRQLAHPCRYSPTGSTARPDDHQCAPVSRMDHKLREVRPHSKSGLQVLRDAVHHSTVHSGAPAEVVSQCPVCSPALDDQSKHHSPRSAQIAGHGNVYSFAGTTEKTPSSSGPVGGCHNMVPEDQELDWPDHSSSVGSVRGGLVGFSSSPTRSSPHHQGNGSDSLHGCVQSGLGSPVRLMLDTGTVVSISKIVALQCSGDAGRHQCCERLSFLIWISEWCAWCATTQWLWLTSRTREAHDRTH